MLVAFFNFWGLIHKDFVPTAQKVNANFYKDVLNRLIKRINRIRPDLHMSGGWFLQHDNALAHNAALVRQFLGKKNCYRPSSPSLFAWFGSSRLFLIPKIKIIIKRKLFWRYSNHPEKHDRYSEGHSGKAFKHALVGLALRSQKCVDLNGAYLYRIITIKYFFTVLHYFSEDQS